MGGYIIKGKFIYNNDMVNLVLQSIDYGSVWKNIRLVSKNIYLLSIKYQESKLIELANPILSLMYIYPNDKWDIYYIIDIGAISIDFIRLTYNKIFWSKKMINMSANLTIDDIINSDPNSIDWYHISKNSSIKVSDMLKHDKLPWNYKAASENTSIRIEDIRNNLNEDWDYYDLSINSSLSIDDLSTIMDLTEYNDWIFNENSTYEDIIKYVDMNMFDMNFITLFIKYIKLDENILQSYLDKLRDRNISVYEINRQSTTPNIIKNNPQIDWDDQEINYSKFTVEEMMNIPTTTKLSIYRMLNHPDFTMEDFFKYFDVNTFTNWLYLSWSPWLTFDIVSEYKDIILWNHIGLSQNPNVTVDILEDSDFSWIEWDYRLLSRNAQLNFVYIIQHNDKDWNSYRLSRNKSLNRKYSQNITIIQ